MVQVKKEVQNTERVDMTLKKAFTLIELLVVIAIIAILAAILFPIMARAKDAAQRSGDMSKMNDIRTALQLYKADQGEYPPALLGYITTYSGDPLANDIIPADQLRNNFLYSKRVPAIETFRPTRNRTAFDVATTAVWPLTPSAGTGGNQRYTTTDVVQRADYSTGVCSNIDARFYKVSGYDAALVPTDTPRTELRYTLFWTTLAATDTPCTPDVTGSASDDPRQMGYADPPDTTVVTWNSFFRDWEVVSGVRLPSRTKRDIVLFLGGSARMMDSRGMYESNWRLRP